ncbi:chemotaxis response regulator protein-glutamate methylesterase [Salinimonas sp. HHU 13199]|uniref:Protein-glutamate methylesterase/protein-glutamine glutaminase n=1 Tax=Salinimonas profundi TaxID=2729140 RepID=A0ABR8LQA8_9ALTE|nr:chemotaxis response regulator protein-glutamate methylesterase [Salinimonas profundi]MBD3586294.1 chemotaxis response regulator protein-glutamate methylesterase [Salinimonas profundi]
MTINVLVVDDSALIRRLLSDIINKTPGLTLAGTAPDAYVARKMVIELSPDVITLDIEMPKVDGLRFLEVLMQAKPTPVVMISTLTERGADATLRALELGAVDFVPKPRLDIAKGIDEYQAIIVSKIRAAASSRLTRVRPRVQQLPRITYTGTEKLVAIGASTGGTEAIKCIIESLPANAPATIITQHMPPGFTTSFAKRLDACSKISVREARGNERLLPGTAYLAPGSQHLTIRRDGADYRTVLQDSPRVSGHKPSVDVMFESVSKNAGHNALGVLLTGMGKDGANGLLTLHKLGAYTICQNEASCVVFGMPKAAIALNAASVVLDISDIPLALLDQLEAVKAGSRL